MCSSNKKRDNLKQKSIDKCKQIYGINPMILKDTTIGQKNYIYNTLGEDFKVFIQNIIKSICNDNHIYRLSSLYNLNRNIQTYDSNSLFEHLQKTNDENLSTNFIYYVLNLNGKLKDKFMSYLVSKTFNLSDYIPSNVKLNKQFAIKVNNGITNKEIKGILDMYIKDDNYNIIIENKIDSGINGKHADIDKDIDQLKTYNKYLIDNNLTNGKVILLVPYKYYNVYKNYNADTLTITYKDIYYFFKDNKYLINLNANYKSEFLNLLYKHSLTREEDIITRFYNTLTK